jgi:exopolyphosphatase/guanosine-5'-triphosphate,3'-diphosphate pyrophosphatase
VRVGAIDIGTNSTRYLLADVTREGRISRVETALKTTRLGEGITLGRLTEQAMARTVAAVAEFWRRAQSMGAHKVTAFATCALREAGNKEDFVRLIGQTTGLELRVLSGEEEAYYTFLGVLTGLEVDCERTVVVDVGGGSTELFWVETGRVFARSLPLGAVRLTVEGGGLPAAEALLRPVGNLVAGRTIIGTGGTITTMAAIALGLAVYSPEQVHGYKIKAEDVVALCHKLSTLSLAARKEIPGLGPERADIILAGVQIVAALLTCTGQGGLTVSENDVLYGAAVKAAGAVERKLAHRY